MKALSCVFAPILLFSSCINQRVLYLHTPDKVNVPGLTKRGDSRLDASAKMQNNGYGTGSRASLSADAGYAVTNHLGVIASYRNLNNREVFNWIHQYNGPTHADESQHFLLNGYRADAGAGIFRPIDRHTTFEAFATIGAGNIANTSGYSDPGYYKANFLSSAAQFDICVYNHYISFCTGGRLSTFMYYEVDLSRNPSLKNPAPNKYLNFYTHFVQLAVGYKYIKANVQAGHEFAIGNHEYSSIYRPSPWYATVGLSFQLEQLYAKHPENH